MTNVIHKNISITNDGSSALRILVLVLALLFIVSPLAGVIIAILTAWLLNTWRLAKFTTFILTVFMWCVESTRSFSMGERGDFPGYKTIFDTIGATPLLRQIFQPSTTTAIFPGTTTVEYGWQLLNRIAVIVFNGDFFHFAYFWIALSYFIIFMALHKYMRSIRADFRYYLCAISFLSFLAPYFALCNNLFRQQTAMSIVIYILVVKVVDNKFKWWWLVIATSLHTMCIAFLPLFFVKLYKKPTLKFMGIAVVFFAIVFFAVQRLDMLSVINLGIFQKLASASEYTGTDVMETTAAIKYFIFVAFMYVAVIGFQKKARPNVIAMMNITMIMALLYIILEPLPLIQIRYYITRFVFLPFIVPFFFGKNNPIGNFYTAGVILVFILMFFNTEFEHFKFTFDELFSNTIFNYNIL